jgi:hypothetical protein
MFEQNKPRLAELDKTFLNSVLVSRFRSSHHCAAHSFANFGIKGTLAIYDSSAVFGFEVPTPTRGYNDRNFKSTALAGRFLPPQKGLPYVTRIFYIYALSEICL